MLLLKKLVFGFPFLLFTFAFLFFIDPFFKDFNLLFSLDLNTLYKLIYCALSLLMACLMFVVFATLANDWKIVSPVYLLVALTAFVIFPPLSGLIIFFGLLISLTLSFTILKDKLRTYLTFHASALLTPAIKNLGFFIVISIGVAFYFATAAEIKQNGFKIPDSILNTAVQFAGQQLPAPIQSGPAVHGESIAQLPTLTKEQIELLRQNPELLRQNGIDPAILDSIPQSPQSLSSPKSTSNEAIKNLLQSQLDKIIDPYIKYLPIAFTVLFIITLQSLFSLVSILLPLLIFLIFWTLEKTNFIYFEKEMREVRKLVV